MSEAELDELAAEHAGEPEPAPEPEPGEPIGEDIPPGLLDELLAGAVMDLGNIICARARVDPIREREALPVGRQLRRLIEVYDVRISPKLAAWAGLAITVGALARPRVIQAQAIVDVDPGPAEDPLADHPSNARPADEGA